MKDLHKRTWVEIHLDDLEHNVRAIRARLPETSRFLGVVKANAYGHGAVPVAKRLEAIGCEYLAVACIDEAIELREAGIEAPILILGYTPPEYAEALAEYRITQAVGSYALAGALSDNLNGKTLRVHMKLETGMGRTGFCTQSAAEMNEASAALKLKGLDFEGVFTHFAVSDEPSQDEYTREQYRRFSAAIGELEAAYGKSFALHHCANSGAVINYPQYAWDMVRPGLITYGIFPAKETAGMDLRPVMELKTRVTQITSHAPGDTISYGRTYMAETQKRLAVLPIGYADGLPRCLSNRLEVLIRGHRVRQVGRICMDMCMVDITDFPDIATGDTVTVFGVDGDEAINVDALAEGANTISYEITCGVSPRVPRIYVK